MTEAYIVKPLSPMRKVIATRMTEVASTVPHFRLTREISVDSLLAARSKLQQLEPSQKLSLNDMLIKACAAALMERPEVNIQWVDGEVRQYATADISIMTAIDGGLATPIIADANAKTVAQISRELKQLTERASRNALKMHEVFGGSFSISNLGMYGIDEFDAIINAPQCAILALGRARPKYVVDESDQPTKATVLRATLSADHRALDGAAAAPFLAAFKQHVEQPDPMLFSGGATS